MAEQHADPGAGSHAGRTLFLALRCALFLIPWLAHLFVADILLSALLPVSAVLPTLAYQLSSIIAELVWRGIQTIFTRINGARIVVTGDELPSGESAIVVSNHVEWTDFYMIQELAIRAGMLGKCRWFAKQQLKWVPFLGWGLWAMGMPLVSRKWVDDQREMDRVFHGAVDRKWPIWLISYSEATRFSLEKRAEAIEWAKKNGKMMPKHLLYPRTKGFIACVKKLRQAPHIKAVYNMTVSYAHGSDFNKPPTFAQTLLLPRLSDKWQFHVNVERWPLDKLPHEDAQLARWLEDRWLEKGQYLEELREMLMRGESWESLTAKNE